MLKYMEFEVYKSNTRTYYRDRVEHFQFNFSLVNQIHREAEYIHVKCVYRAASHSAHPLWFHVVFHIVLLLSFRFINIEMKSVRFEDSLFENCYFENIKSTDTFFENCTIKNTIFYNTGTTS